MIELKKGEKFFNKGKSNELHVLNNINLKIEKKSIYAIIGPSGSGKSTLLNIIGCLDELTSGSYFLNGQNITLLNQKQLARIRNESFGFVVQDFALIENYTVFKNVELPIQYSKRKQDKRKRIYELLERLGIEDKIDENASNLSGGQRQRVAIARALINDPAIILADEPTGALDQKTGQQVMNIFKNIQKESNKTILLVTHNHDIAEQCGSIINIIDGEMRIEKNL